MRQKKIPAPAVPNCECFRNPEQILSLNGWGRLESENCLENTKPFLSILIIVGTLFSLVFLQMEERRMGYMILRLTREQRTVMDEKREKAMLLAKVTRPQHVEKMAHNRLSLQKIQAGQIIHLTRSAQASVIDSESKDIN
jgi:hypothetical protein